MFWVMVSIVSGKISIYIVDDNFDYVYLVEECLGTVQEFELCGKAHDGETAVREILIKRPDVVLLDVVLPQMDGIAVLEELQKVDAPKPIIIMLTAIGQDKYVKKALSLGAEYYILKPYDMTLLPKRIIQIYQDCEKNAKSLKESNTSSTVPMGPGKEPQADDRRATAVAGAKKALLDMGMPSYLNGYNYLLEAIVETVLSEKGYIPITKELYPMIARHFDTSVGKVERTIRSAVQRIWQRVNSQKLSQYFPSASHHMAVHPTNSEFIASVADKIRISYFSK